MDNIVFNSVEDVRQNMNTGDSQKDLETINAILAGNVQINREQDATVTEPTDDSTTQVDPTIDVVEPTVDPVQEEIERTRRYNEMLDRQRREEHDDYIRKLKEKEDQIAKEKKAREELQNSLQELQSLKKSTTDADTQNTDDDEYVSEYTKQTRRMVEELKASVGSDNPVVKKLIDEVEKIKTDYNSEKERNEQFQREKAEKLAQEKLFDNIRNFQNGVPELKTSKDIVDIDSDYQRFRKDIAYLTKARSSEDVEKAIDEYNRGGTVKELADKNGIKPVEDYDKYMSVVELLDLKEGIKYDPVLGKHIPILDENGVQVRYRSMDEAYRVKNFYSNISNAKREAYKDVSKKLTEFKQSPTLLPSNNTDSFSSGMTLEQERELLNMDPNRWINDPEKRRLVEIVYSKRGLEMPKYRGKRI